jgi:hypothetical protein
VPKGWNALGQSAGEYVTLVLRCEPTVNGRWSLAIEGFPAPAANTLSPATLVVRLWRIPETSLLRGTVHLQGDEHGAAFASNVDLERLVRGWLFNER